MSMITLCSCNPLFVAKALMCHAAAAESVTTSLDASNVQYYCNTFIWIVAIIVIAFIACKLMNHIAKGISEKNERAWDVEDRKKKRIADLQDKLLDFEKSLSFPYEKGKDGEFKKKEYKADESKKYIAHLVTLIQGGKIESEKNEEEKP